MFIYSEKAKKFCKILTLLLTGTTQDKSKVKISQNFVAFSEYMNFARYFFISFTLATRDLEEQKIRIESSSSINND